MLLEVKLYINDKVGLFFSSVRFVCFWDSLMFVLWFCWSPTFYWFRLDLMWFDVASCIRTLNSCLHWCENFAETTSSIYWKLLSHCPWLVLRFAFYLGHLFFFWQVSKRKNMLMKRPIHQRTQVFNWDIINMSTTWLIGWGRFCSTHWDIKPYCVYHDFHIA